MSDTTTKNTTQLKHKEKNKTNNDIQSSLSSESNKKKILAF